MVTSGKTIAPVALFVYKRPDHLRETLTALLRNELVPSTPLHVFCDAPKNPEHGAKVREVRELVQSIRGFKSVEYVYRETNLGIAKSIRSGLSSMLAKYPSCIVLEDDIVVSPFFLNFMNTALDFYQSDPRIATISGYSYPRPIFKVPRHYTDRVFFTRRVFPWGWATWADRWNQIIWDKAFYEPVLTDGRVRQQLNSIHPHMSNWLIAAVDRRADTWSNQMTYFFLQKGMYNVFPVPSYANNIGNDFSGSTKQAKPSFVHKRFDAPRDIPLVPLKVDQALLKAFAEAGTMAQGVDIYYYYRKLRAFFVRLIDEKGMFYVCIRVINSIDPHGRLHRTVRAMSNYVLRKIHSWHRPGPALKPYMTDAEIEFLKSNLRESSVVLEWGSGYSTLSFAPLVRKYVAIEHHQKWFERVRQKISRNTTLIYAPPEPTYTPRLKGWNTDFEGSYATFQRYVDVFDTLQDTFDVIFIDGRARVECARKIFAHLPRNQSFVHDFDRYWADLSANYTLETLVDQLALLRKNSAVRPRVAAEPASS